MLKKNEGKLRGWLAYTLSKSEQLTSGRNSSEPGINNGNWYNTPYDKTHDLSINTKNKINKNIKIVGNFILQTGQPTNYPNSQYNYMNLNVPNYGERNSQRLPNYHRLDINLTLTPNRNGKKIERTPVWLMRQAGRILPEYRKIRNSLSGFKELVETPHLAAAVSYTHLTLPTILLV